MGRNGERIMINLPTTQQIYNNIIADLEAQYNITIPSIGKSFLRAYASVLAAQIKLVYLLVGKVQKNIFVDTADPASQGGTLERFGFVKLGRYPFKATQGIYEIQATGTIGATIPAGTTFKSNDDSLNPGFLFINDTLVTLAATTQNFNVRALTAGLESQLQVGNELTVTAPLANIESIFSVISEVTEPIAAEGIEVYRQKAIDAYRLEPQGGAGADYRLWASDAQGVKQSYPYAAPGNGNQVVLYIEATIADSTDGKGTPTTAILDVVEDAIEDPTVDRPSRKPITDTVTYLGITPLDIVITIAGSSFTGAQETLIDQSIENFLLNVRPFIASIDVLANRNDIFDTNKIISIILEAVPGSSFGAIGLNVDGNNVSTFTFLNGDIPIIDEVQYV